MVGSIGLDVHGSVHTCIHEYNYTGIILYVYIVPVQNAKLITSLISTLSLSD